MNSKSHFKKLFTHGGGYFFVSLLTKATNFILLPIITRYLSLEEYGLYTNIQATQSLFYLLATLSLDAAYGRYIYDYNQSEKRLRILTSTIFTALIIWNAFYLTISIYIFSYLLESWNYYSILILLIVPITTIFNQTISLSTALMQSRHDTKKLLTISTLSFALTQTILLLLLIIFNMGIKSFFLAQFTASLLSLILHLKYLNRNNLITIPILRKKILIKNIKYALGYIPASFSGWIFSLSDRYIITFYLSLSAAGKYAFIVQLTMIIQVLMNSLDTAYGPIFMKLMKEKQYNSIKSYINFMAFFLLTIFLCMCLLLPDIITLIFPEKYHGNTSLIYILSLGYIFLSMRKIFANTLMYFKKSLLISISGYIPAFSNLILNIIFIPIYGIEAAATTTMISFILYAGIVYYFSQKLINLNPGLLSISTATLAAISIVFISDQLQSIVADIILIPIFITFCHSIGMTKFIRA